MLDLGISVMWRLLLEMLGLGFLGRSLGLLSLMFIYSVLRTLGLNLDPSFELHFYLVGKKCSTSPLYILCNFNTNDL